MVVQTQKSGKKDPFLEEVRIWGIGDQIHQKKVGLVIMGGQNKKGFFVDILHNFLGIEVITAISLAFGFPNKFDIISLFDFLFFQKIGSSHDF